MPNITLIRSHLFEAIGEHYTDEEFDEICFQFGVEVDDVAEEVIEFTDGSKETHVVYVIAIPANRYDLLCMEGFARAIRIFLSKEQAPRFLKTPGQEVIHVDSSTKAIRPYVVCAILRNVSFDVRKYKSFMDLQEKLHQNICRKRTFVAIGTHDLDTLKGPFHYKALPPQDIRFVPLTEETQEFDAKSLLDFYRESPTAKHLKPYTDIVYNSPVYPVIYDSNNVVLSLPPIINGRHSRIQLTTKNVFIECTATDLTKANIVLDTVVAMFSEYCEEKFSVETVEVRYDDVTYTTPKMSQRACDTRLSDVNGIIGINVTPDEVCKLCDRMQLGPSEYIADTNVIRVQVPPTRSDVLHPVDVIEDVAIAYGYNNLNHTIPNTLTFGCALPINHFTDLLRQEIAQGGFMEMLTHGLCSENENFAFLNRPVGPAAYLSNPANVEYEVVRTTLIPGALKTLAHNKSMSHKEGIKLFEISDVVLLADNEIGAKNVRRLVGLHAAHVSAFEVVHGLVDRIMRCSQIKPDAAYASSSLTTEEYAELTKATKANVDYYLRPSSDNLFFPGMGADVVLRKLNSDGSTETETVLGCLGVVHPDVLAHYEISYPCTVVELDIEPLL